MDAVIRAAAIYSILIVLFRLSGRRTVAEMTAFDFVLILIIGEATQQALLGEDFSMTNAAIVIATLLFIDIMMSLLKSRSEKVSKLLDGVPTIVVENGRALERCMRKARIDVDDVMEAARRLQGIERLDQIRFAVLEISGGITVIPYERKAGEEP
ncbi:MAG: DUF421 domain-containing protein [Steroidobacter sp.]